MNKVLTKLTKNILTSLPYISNNVECKSVSRATLIADIEKNLSNHEPIELYSIFKYRIRPQVPFPKRKENLREIQQHSYKADSEMDTQDSATCEPPNSFVEFPPVPLTEEAQHKIIQNYCTDMDPSNFHESDVQFVAVLHLLLHQSHQRICHLNI